MFRILRYETIDLKVNREVYASRGWRIWPKAAKNVHVG